MHMTDNVLNGTTWGHLVLKVEWGVIDISSLISLVGQRSEVVNNWEANQPRGPDSHRLESLGATDGKNWMQLIMYCILPGREKLVRLLSQNIFREKPISFFTLLCKLAMDHWSVRRIYSVPQVVRLFLFRGCRGENLYIVSWSFLVKGNSPGPDHALSLTHIQHLRPKPLGHGFSQIILEITIVSNIYISKVLCLIGLPVNDKLAQLISLVLNVAGCLMRH